MGQGGDFAPQGTLDKIWINFGCHNEEEADAAYIQEVEARVTAEDPTMHWTITRNKGLSVPK